ncbi:hypothetical protein B6257_11310 [Bacillus velezensis]|nr:hypothetical protein B6257_11310 [Bacillus velezensis]
MFDQLVEEDHLLRKIDKYLDVLFLHLKSNEYVKKQHKTKKLAEKTSFSLQAEGRYPAFFTLFGPGF